MQLPPKADVDVFEVDEKPSQMTLFRDGTGLGRQKTMFIFRLIKLPKSFKPFASSLLDAEIGLRSHHRVGSSSSIRFMTGTNVFKTCCFVAATIMKHGEAT